MSSYCRQHMKRFAFLTIIYFCLYGIALSKNTDLLCKFTHAKDRAINLSLDFKNQKYTWQASGPFNFYLKSGIIYGQIDLVSGNLFTISAFTLNRKNGGLLANVYEISDEQQKELASAATNQSMDWMFDNKKKEKNYHIKAIHDQLQKKFKSAHDITLNCDIAPKNKF